MSREQIPGAQLRQIKKIMRDQNCTKSDAKRIYWAIHVAQKRSCKMRNFKQLKLLAETRMRPVIHFFTGMTLKWFKRWYRRIIQDRREYENHELLRPWIYEAYRNCINLRSSSELRNVTSKKQTLTLPLDSKCGPKCKHSLPLGVVMKLAVGAFNIGLWRKYCANLGERTEYDYSHLHGLNKCINPLNGVVEKRGINLDRKNCHSKAFASDILFCNRHRNAPCFLGGRRMCCSQFRVAKKMIQCVMEGKPAITAYDDVAFKFVAVDGTDSES